MPSNQPGSRNFKVSDGVLDKSIMPVLCLLRLVNRILITNRVGFAQRATIRLVGWFSLAKQIGLTCSRVDSGKNDWRYACFNQRSVIHFGADGYIFQKLPG